jgi:hypothetical protein
MSYGYSLRLVERNSRADVRDLGVQLGRVCIKHDVPVAVVATAFGVSRQTIYNWFIGGTSPGESYHDLIRTYISQL